jgi:hypothetical protein
MLAVPLTRLLLIRGLEEYSTDPQDSPSLARHYRSFLRACRIFRGARLLLRGANRQQQYSQSGQKGQNGHWLAQHAQIVATILVSAPEASIHENRPARRSFRSFQGSALSGADLPARLEKRMPHPSIRDGWVAMLMVSADFVPAHPSKSDGWGSLG